MSKLTYRNLEYQYLRKVHQLKRHFRRSQCFYSILKPSIEIRNGQFNPENLINETESMKQMKQMFCFMTALGSLKLKLLSQFEYQFGKCINLNISKNNNLITFHVMTYKNSFVEINMPLLIESIDFRK